MKRLVSEIMLALLLIGMLTLAFDSPHVGAEPRTIVVPDEHRTIQEAINAAGLGDTVYVKAGIYYESVVVNKTVSLIGESINATMIVAGWEANAFYVKADNVSIRGFAVRGSNGILVEGSVNSSISGNNIEGEVEYVDFPVYFRYHGNGIHLHNSSNCLVSENVISYTQMAMRLDSSVNCSIQGNSVVGNEYGISLEGSSDSSLLDNIVNGNFFGITLGKIPRTIGDVFRSSPSTNMILRNNKMSGNRLNFGIGGLLHNTLSEFIHDVDSSNTVDGRPIYYLVNQRDRVIPSDAGYVAIINSTNVTVQNLTLTGNWQGVLLACATNSTIQNVTATDDFHGIYMFESQAIVIIGNDLRDNEISVELTRSSNCTITENSIRDNRVLWGSSWNWGFGIGIAVGSSSDNMIYHNNFINNDEHAALGFMPGQSSNLWNDGYPSGGNFWSDYNGVDWYRGPYQNETGSDGIGDSPYIINSDNIDKYPLMKPYPWNPHDIAITRAGSKTVVGQGFDLHIHVTIFNYGMSAETVNVSAYANTTIIQTETVTLASRDSSTIAFTWNTTGFAKGNYTIRAYAWPVPGETDTADNTFMHGTVYVGIPGDVDGDGKVDILDIATIARAYGAYPGHPKWNPNADLDNSNLIDILDIAKATKNYGKAYS